MSALLRFLALYACMYAAFGVSSPFMPAFFKARGLAPEQIGLLFAAGTAIRLVSAPLVGRLADLTRSLRAVLSACELVAASVALALISTPAFAPLLLVSLLHAAALAPTTALADALALGAAEPRDTRSGDTRRRFEYGWVRGTGSAVFVAGTLLSGQIVGSRGLASIIVLQAALLAGAAVAALLLPAPRLEPASADERAARAGVAALLRVPEFRRVMLVSALVLGSHAMHDTFAVIRWGAAGITPALASVLWSEAVAAEVLVFFLVGPALLTRLHPATMVSVAAGAGIVRWAAMASSSSATVLVLVQPLHGLTFAALHLACMRLIPAIVPFGLAATAQALYAFSAGATTALLTLASGWIYARFSAQGFLVMALLCAFVPLLTGPLREVDAPAGSGAQR
jgi:MFS transporter, PPP family, 3-phenylpropionic acid transporter